MRLPDYAMGVLLFDINHGSFGVCNESSQLVESQSMTAIFGLLDSWEHVLSV